MPSVAAPERAARALAIFDLPGEAMNPFPTLFLQNLRSASCGECVTIEAAALSPTNAPKMKAPRWSPTAALS